MVKFAKKLTYVCKGLQEWNYCSFGNIFQRVKDAENLQQFREREFYTVRDEESKVCLHETRAKHARELAIECDYWHQKAAIKWLKVR